MIENAHTGERIEFVEQTPERLVMEVEWPRPGRRALPHRHPGMEERWTVLEGLAAFRIGAADAVTAGPGETVVAPPGVVHEAYNAGSGPARVRIEMRPPLRWREFVERLFAGDEDPRELVARFEPEIGF